MPEGPLRWCRALSWGSVFGQTDSAKRHATVEPHRYRKFGLSNEDLDLSIASLEQVSWRFEKYVPSFLAQWPPMLVLCVPLCGSVGNDGQCGGVQVAIDYGSVVVYRWPVTIAIYSTPPFI